MTAFDRIQSLAQLEQLKADSPMLALYLRSESCGPCHALWPRIEAAFGVPPWRLAVAEQSEASEVFGQLLVFAVPTLMVYLEGQLFSQHARIIPDAALQATKARAEALMNAPEAG